MNNISNSFYWQHTNDLDFLNFVTEDVLKQFLMLSKNTNNLHSWIKLLRQNKKVYFSSKKLLSPETNVVCNALRFWQKNSSKFKNKYR